MIQRAFAFIAAALPFWVELALPLLLLPAAVLSRVLNRRRLFAFCALGVCGAGLLLSACRGIEGYPFAYIGLCAVLLALFAPVLSIPAPKKKKGGRKSKRERMYETFRLELEEDAGDPPPRDPPKVCCFEEDAFSAEESGFRLAHVRGLLEKLRACKLTAADRLETDALARTIESCGEKPLTAGEVRTLNDCLASVLKLTAKYKL